ncbi:MAG: hypothetical protein AAGA62_02900, partial [Bacteroidota bacterium]
MRRFTNLIAFAVFCFFLFCNATLRSEVIISQDACWLNTQDLDEDITVLGGVTLTIKGTVRLGPWRKINVRQGGHLIVDGGTITSISIGLNQAWRGIYVEANPWSPQTDVESTGTVMVINGSLIENSRNGIGTYRFGPGQNSGGIVTCIESDFRNNGRSIEFLRFTTGDDNLSAVDGCTFLIDEAFLKFGMKFIGHITSWRNKQITIEQSRFEIEEDIADNPLFTGKWGVYYRQTSGEIQGNEFLHLPIGLEANQEGSPDVAHDPVNLLGNIFTGNGVSAKIRSDELSANLNFFHVSYHTKEAIGLQIDNSTDYSVQENEFMEGDPLAPSNNTGIKVTDSGPEQNELTRNAFEDLNIGILAVGINRDDWQQGLKILCSHFGANKTAIKVASNDSGQYQGIASNQGIRRASAGNTFKSNNIDIENQTVNEIRYPYEDPIFNDPADLVIPENIFGLVFVYPTIAAPLCEDDMDGDFNESELGKSFLRTSTPIRLHISPNPATSSVNINLPRE